MTIIIGLSQWCKCWMAKGTRRARELEEIDTTFWLCIILLLHLHWRVFHNLFSLYLCNVKRHWTRSVWVFVYEQRERASHSRNSQKESSPMVRDREKSVVARTVAILRLTRWATRVIFCLIWINNFLVSCLKFLEDCCSI